MNTCKSESKRKQIWNHYCDAGFSMVNPLSKSAYESAAISYDYNYKPFLPKDRRAKILDMGCGMGHFLYYLYKRNYTNFIGIDISKQQIEFIKKNISACEELAESFKKISEKVYHADAFTFLKHHESEYDLIVANDLIEHIKKDEILQLLRLIRNSLKENGIFVAKTGNMANPFNLRLRYIDITHEIGYNEISLFQILKISNFSEINIYPMRSRKRDHMIIRTMRNAILPLIGLLFGVHISRLYEPLIFCVAEK